MLFSVSTKHALPLTAVILLLLLPSSVFCQPNESNFIRYTIKNGLSHNYISGIIQDSSGYIWISTHKGLNRFDGTAFKSYYKNDPAIPLPDNYIENISINNHNELLLATYAGVLIVNAKSFQQKKLFVPSDSSIFFWTNHFTDAQQDTMGNFIASGKTGLYVFNAKGNIIKRYDYYFPEDVGKKEFWFGSWLKKQKKGTVWHYNEKSLFCYNPFANKIEDLCKNNNWLQTIYSSVYKDLTTLQPGNNGQLFFFNTKKNTLTIADVSRKTTETIPAGFNVNEEIDDNSKIIILDNSQIAVTGKASGFYIADKKNKAGKYEFLKQKFLPDKFCTLLFRDKEGRLWVGTSDGLFKHNLYSSFFKSYDLSAQSKTITNQPIRAVLVKGNKIFAGLRNGGGLLVLNKTTLQAEHHLNWNTNDMYANSVHVLFNYNTDTIWAGTQKGLYWVNTKNYSYGKIKMSSSLAWTESYLQQCMYRDKRGRIWISYSKVNGLIYYDPHERKFTELDLQKNPLFKLTFCRSIIEDHNGNVWFSGDGLCRWNYAKQKIDTLIQYAVVSNTMRNHMLMQDIDSSNKIWISGFDNELLTFDCNTGVTAIRKGLDRYMNGNNVISSPIIKDHLWLAADNGITAFNIKNSVVRQFNYADGLPSVAISTGRRGWSYDSAENYFYIGARQYLIKFRPDIDLSSRTAPRLVLEHAKTNRRKIIFPGDDLELSYKENNLTIHFSAINFTDSEDNRFAFKMQETDTAWQEIQEKNSITFYNLPNGSYNFQLKLFSANNRWEPVYSKMFFTIRPPLWKTTWFIILSFILLSSLIYLLFKLRTKSIRNKANLNNQLASLELKALHAQMNPHFIFNALNSIKEMILNDEKNNASRYLSKFAQLIRLNLEHAQLPFISLRQNIEYMEKYLEMEQLRFSNFTYQIQTDSTLNTDEIKIAPMLLQPLAENAIWHGLLPLEGEKKLLLRFRKADNYLYCEIEDNGVGLLSSLSAKKESQTTHHSRGIENILHRIRVINEKYNLQYRIELQENMHIDRTGGTMAVLSLPLLNTDILL